MEVNVNVPIPDPATVRNRKTELPSRSSSFEFIRFMDGLLRKYPDRGDLRTVRLCRHRGQRSGQWDRRGTPGKDIRSLFHHQETGTGLGLTSVYSIVRKHGGDILVSSEVGKGIRFEVYLPASRLSTAHGDGLAAPTIAAAKGSILVMDDETFIREMVSEMLAHLGYDTEGCKFGEELVWMHK